MTIATYLKEEKDWILIKDSDSETNYIRKRTDDSTWFKTVYKNYKN